MGKQVDGIELQIKEHRRQIEGSVNAFRERRDSDVTGVLAPVKSRVSGVVADAREFVGLEERMRKHPYRLLAAGVGAGALIGVVTRAGGHAGWEDDYGDESPETPGLFSSVSGPIGMAEESRRSGIRGLVLDLLQGLVMDLVQDFVADLVSRMIARARDSNSSPAPAVMEA